MGQNTPPRVLTNNDKSVYQRLEVGGRTWLFEEINGQAIVEGDMRFGPVAAFHHGAKGFRRDASIVKGHRWPGGVVPYVIDATDADNPQLTEIVQAAILHWQQHAGFRFVARDQQTNYVRFQSAPDGCWSDAVGVSDSGPQTVNLSAGSFTPQAIHEIGHAVGLFHEQSRHDRDKFLQVRTEQVAPDVLDPNFIIDPNGIDNGYYDYDSIMHYGAADFSVAGAAVLSTIPPGIPIGQRRGLSPGDVAAASALNGLTQKPYIVMSNPAGLVVTVDGGRCMTPCAYRWTDGSTHTVDVPTPQPAAFPALAQTAGSWQWYFARWNDDGARSHQIKADPNYAVLTANFSQMSLEDLADLAVVKFTAASSGAAGQRLGSIHAEIQNAGHEAAGPFRLAFYVSPTAAITRDNALGYCYFQGLPAGASAICDGAAYCYQVGNPQAVAPCEGGFQVPASLAAGTYYVGAIADGAFQVPEGNEQNNTLANQNGATTIVSSAAGSADLEVVSFSAGTKGVIGGTISQVRAEVRNRGLGPSGPFRLGYYVSKTPNIEADGLYTRWSCTVDQGLEPGETVVCSGDIKVRPDLAAGTYYLAAKADDLHQVAEGDETNNVKLNAQGTVQLSKVDPWAPDLVVTALQAPAGATVGDKLVGVTVKVQNIGSTRAGGFRVGIYLSADGVISTQDVYAAGCISSGLAAGAVFSCAGAIPVPAALTAGIYYVGAIADDLGEVLEVNEQNNARASDRGATVLTVRAGR